MKKILICLLTVTMCLALASCGSKEEIEETKESEETEAVEEETTVANPMLEVESVDAINEAIGSKILELNGEDESYYVINGTLGQYGFKLDGKEYVLRASADLSEDISGVYVDEGTAFEGYASYLEIVALEEGRLARFVYDDIQYVLHLKESESDYDAFDNIVMSLLCDIAEGCDSGILELCGKYSDQYSGRASLRIYPYDENSAAMIIEWADSASAYAQWKIIAQREENKLNYDIIEHLYIDESGETAINDAMAGYFTITDEGIAWDGSGNENTSSCLFVKDAQ